MQVTASYSGESTEKYGVLVQRSEFVNPGKRTFTGKTTFVNIFVEEPSSATFGDLAVSPILINVWDQTMIEACFSGSFGVKSLISVEVHS